MKFFLGGVGGNHPYRSINSICRTIQRIVPILLQNSLLKIQLQADWIISHEHVCVFYQVVVKTKADYDGEGKKGKLRSPKIAEFSISIIEGVSERLKVRMISPQSSVCFIHHSIFQYRSHTPTLAYAGEQTAVSLQLRTFVIAVIIFPLSNPSYTLLCSGHLHLLCPVQPVMLSGYTGRHNAQ